jgi:hypothetical protein
MRATTNTILLTPRKTLAKQFVALRPKAVSSRAEIRASLPTAGRHTLWISDDQKLVSELLKAVSWPTKRLGRAVLMFTPRVESLPALRQCFDRVVFGENGGLLASDELSEAVSARHRAELFIGGAVDRASETVTLWRGNLESLVVSFAAFPTSGDGIEPDFAAFSITDGGQTVRLGRYEAAADAILYEYDPEYRRQKSKERRASEQTLGASIRRLRKQRGLRREDFEPLAAKTLARIEQGKVTAVHGKTLKTIAAVLGVPEKDLGTY